jgi:hypothetical protein
MPVPEYIHNNSGVYITTGPHTTYASLFVTDGRMEFHDTFHGTFVTGVRAFWNLHATTFGIVEDLTYDQLLDRISIRYLPIKDAWQYPEGSSKTLTKILAMTPCSWAAHQKRIDAFKGGEFRSRIFDYVPIGTEVCYQEPGGPALSLILFMDEWGLPYFEYAEQRWGIHEKRTERFNALTHVRNWYNKYIYSGPVRQTYPLAHLTFESGAYKGMSASTLMDQSPTEWCGLMTSPERPLFPPSSLRGYDFHQHNLAHLFNHISETPYGSERIPPMIHLFEYCMGNSDFLRAWPELLTAFIRRVVFLHETEPAIHSECKKVMDFFTETT